MKPKTITLFIDQLSYGRVRGTLLFLLFGGIFTYIVLVVLSTTTIAHSKTLLSDIRSTQDAVTELNAEVSLRNQELALELQKHAMYVTPKEISYIERSTILNPALALE